MDLSDLHRLQAPPGAAPATEAGAIRGRLLLATGNAGPGPAARTEALLGNLRQARFMVRRVDMAEASDVVALTPADALLIHAADAPAEMLALIRQLRRHPACAQLPVVVIAAPGLDAMRGPAMVAGATHWLSEPVHLAGLTSILMHCTLMNRLQGVAPAAPPRPTIEHLDTLIDTGLRLAMERDRARLLRHLLASGQKLLHCDGGTMYMVTERDTLRFEMRTRDDALPSLEIPLRDAATGQPNQNYVSVYTAVHNRSVVIDDVYAETRFDLTGTRAFDAQSGYRTVSMLAVPISPRGGQAVGVLQFFNALDRHSGEVVPFDARMVQLVEALAAQAAVALDNIALVESQKQLMESLIRLLATAIDAKSSYTGRHCERVPELAMMLAQAACDTQQGPLADFRFASEAEWQEFRIGAWLHDCGKVTTPEYVIDKATKLETIHNRIHEVRMRFEVLWRDLEIEELRASAAGALTPELQQGFAARRQALQDNFAFIAQCNLGSEAMRDEDLARLQALAQVTWVRHFDDRLGLSAAELDRRRNQPPAPLPAVEPLLADKAHDVIQRPPEQALDPAFGFHMAVPQHLYNLGELHNLGVRRGTLTAEERYKINEHMVHTIMMLERMPFPKELRRVPEYAGTHHERMDGKGYPRALQAHELSVPSRIMAVADVFEALTASDRPYKKAKTLSEALTVMRGMAGDHVDPHVFNLFLSSGVFLEFARKHLNPDQIDVADGSAFMVDATPQEPRDAGR
ncbi:HD domain-containing phosphohydrolase [uncultured Aquincola sp.]|uniref:HD domain-containing phosphohydrolase n=1 Tax=uncultured Aquincola sp. TaxID=886556 RepID=UPI0032B21289